MDSQNSPTQSGSRRLLLPLGVLILGGTFLFALGLVLGVVLEPSYVKVLLKVTGNKRGTITADQFGRLSSGMSEKLVLASAHEPYLKTAKGQWIYIRDDGSVVSLWFAGGKISKIQEVKIVSHE
jgi:hypothetical protein